MSEIKPDTAHTEYQAQAAHYEMMRDFYRGVGAVREKGETYLPKTQGMINAEDQKKADARYKAFVSRATYPGVFRHTVSSIVGVTTAKAPQVIDIPASWGDIEECATTEGEPLKALQGRCVRELSKMGRMGLMTDLRSPDEPTPVITPFFAHQIINWRMALDDGKWVLTLLVLRKSEAIEADEYWNDGTLEVVESFELLRGGVLKRRFEKRPAANGQSNEWVEVATAQPRAKTQQTGAEATQDEAGRLNGFRLMEIPFTPLNTNGISIDPVDPPFLDLVNKLRDIYIGSANYRESMSMYEPTPVVTGLTEEWIKAGLAPQYMGVGAIWLLPHGADGKMLEYTGPNISDIRQALMDDTAEAERLATQPFERMTAAPESGEARKERAKVKTNVIREIHLAAGAGVQEALRKAARWTGENDEAVVYKVADDLDQVDMSPAELRELTSSWMAGLVPDMDAHSRLRSGGYTQLDYEKWRSEREGGETGALVGGDA